jgi:TolB-like protein
MKRQHESVERVVASVLFILVAGFLFAGCASEDVYHEPNMDFGSVRSVAVLPFTDLTRGDEAAERVRDTFMGMLLATGAVYVLPPGEVARGMSKIGRIPDQGPSTEQIKQLSRILDVQGVITGVVREYGSVRSGATSANVVSISLQMIEVDSGMVVWSASSTKGGVTYLDRLIGGGGEPMDTVTVKAINELLDKLFE